MDIRLLTVSNAMPSWISEGFKSFEKRLPKHEIKLALIEIPPSKKKVPQEVKKEEAQKIETLLKQSNHECIILDVQGLALSSEKLANKLAYYQDNSVGLDIVIGGAYGLAEEIKARAKVRWSLSAMTLPHMFARLIMIEQIYRAWAINNNHPYHK